MSKLDGGSGLKLFLIVIALWHQQSMSAYTNRGGMHNPISTSTAGIDMREEMNVRNRKSEEIKKYMNLDADPCKDFFDYACGNWAKHQREYMQEGEQRTAQNLVELQISRELQSMLEEPPKQQDGPNMRKVRDFYASCVKVEDPSSVQFNFLNKFIQEHGGLFLIPNSGWQSQYDWVQIIAQLRAEYGMDILIGLEIDTNLQSNQRGNSIYLGEPKTTLIPPEYCSTIATQEANSKDQVYEEIQSVIAANMQRWLNVGESNSKIFAGDIIRFEFELCKHMRSDHSMVDSQPENVGPESHPERSGARSRTGQNRLHGLRESAAPTTTYPRMSLLQLTQQHENRIDYQMFVDLTFDSRITNPVYVRNEAYLQQLAHVTTKKVNKHTIADYIMYRAMLELNLPSNDLIMIPRPQICVQLVQRYFPKIIGEMYLRRIHRSESSSDLAEIFNEIIKTFDERLENDWMDENDKRAVRQKLTQYKLSFVDYQNLDLNDLQIEGIDYWRKLEQILKFNAKQKLNRLKNGDYGQRGEAVDSYEVRMKIMPINQEISSGWGLLQPPFYNYYYPQALKFALLAQRIARELIYAFDEQGWNQNPFNPMHWRSETMDAYRNRSECYRAQYSNYLFNNPETFRNASKLREIIADSSALNIGFGAYLNWLERMDSKSRLLSRETLPNLNFSNTQLFFIYFAQTHCVAKQEEDNTPTFLPLELHKPERYDVNGPLSNYEEFGREFGCAVGNEMNNDDRCLIY